MARQENAVDLDSLQGRTRPHGQGPADSVQALRRPPTSTLSTCHLRPWAHNCVPHRGRRSGTRYHRHLRRAALGVSTCWSRRGQPLRQAGLSCAYDPYGSMPRPPEWAIGDSLRRQWIAPDVPDIILGLLPRLMSRVLGRPRRPVSTRGAPQTDVEIVTSAPSRFADRRKTAGGRAGMASAAPCMKGHSLPRNRKLSAEGGPITGETMGRAGNGRASRKARTISRSESGRPLLQTARVRRYREYRGAP